MLQHTLQYTCNENGRTSTGDTDILNTQQTTVECSAKGCILRGANIIQQMQYSHG
jgi:hypothetical protein